MQEARSPDEEGPPPRQQWLPSVVVINPGRGNVALGNPSALRGRSRSATPSGNPERISIAAYPAIPPYRPPCHRGA
jgi:hypothetical protein